MNTIDKPVCEELEEAAHAHIQEVIDAAGHPGWDWETQDIKDAFIAGAKWQKQKMGEQAREHLSKLDDLTLDDLVAFDEGLQLGRRLERQDMMKEAVEGYVTRSIDGELVAKAILFDSDGLKFGDFVKLIIIKEDEK